VLRRYEVSQHLCDDAVTTASAGIATASAAAAAAAAGPAAAGPADSGCGAMLGRWSSDNVARLHLSEDNIINTYSEHREICTCMCDMIHIVL
jgi:hypothetical protein